MLFIGSLALAAKGLSMSVQYFTALTHVVPTRTAHHHVVPSRPGMATEQGLYPSCCAQMERP